jgi:hypothetical protein
MTSVLVLGIMGIEQKTFEKHGRVKFPDSTAAIMLPFAAGMASSVKIRHLRELLARSIFLIDARLA